MSYDVVMLARQVRSVIRFVVVVGLLAALGCGAPDLFEVEGQVQTGAEGSLVLVTIDPDQSGLQLTAASAEVQVELDRATSSVGAFRLTGYADDGAATTFVVVSLVEIEADDPYWNQVPGSVPSAR